jgi:hypothetical protein
LRKYFDRHITITAPINTECRPINLIFDGTFFSRSDGVLVFRANGKNIYWRFIKSETLIDIELSIAHLIGQNYHFKSFTIDGRKGVIQLLERLFPGTPIQLCQFHQSQIIRRYTTSKPKTECGIALKALMKILTEVDYFIFQKQLELLQIKYDDFLKQRNEQGQFKHRQLRSAFRSLKTNLPYLFTYKTFPDLTVPNTTNSCDGSFAHWKQKLKIHRGLRKHRRNKMINYLLTKS